MKLVWSIVQMKLLVIFEILFALHIHQQKNIPAHPPEMVKNIG
jgi:hypothetical protein